MSRRRKMGDAWLLSLRKCPGCAQVALLDQPCGLGEPYCVVAWGQANRKRILRETRIALKLLADDINEEGQYVGRDESVADLQERINDAMLRAYADDAATMPEEEQP